MDKIDTLFVDENSQGKELMNFDDNFFSLFFPLEDDMGKV